MRSSATLACTSWGIMKNVAWRSMRSISKTAEWSVCSVPDDYPADAASTYQTWRRRPSQLRSSQLVFTEYAAPTYQ